jgi:hypothetical protein
MLLPSLQEAMAISRPAAWRHRWHSPGAHLAFAIGLLVAYHGHESLPLLLEH